VSSLRTLALLGLPKTGKSTYLGALWQLVQDTNEPGVVERDVTGDRSHLQFLGEKVALCEEIGRTEVESTEGMLLTLGFDEFGDAEISIPDISGETLRVLVETRHWHPRIESVLTEAESLVIFISADQLRVPFSISMANGVLEEARRTVPASNGDTPGVRSPSGDPVGTSSEESAGTDPDEATVLPEEDDDTIEVQDPTNLTARLKIPKFKVEKASTAAKYVDALENLLASRRAHWPVRVAIVVSAWDTPERSGFRKPGEWLRKRLPSVLSMSTVNGDMMETRVFGVSAQGGPLPEKKADLLPLSVRERAFARDGDGNGVPIFEPLRWALWG
jgi:hypothetical protein